MINLLPPKNKEYFLAEKSWKIVLILSVNLLAILVCFSLILYSINVFVSGKLNFQKIISQQKEKELAMPKIQDFSQNLKNFNQTFSDLDYFYENQVKITEILGQVSKTVPLEVYLTNLSINFGNKEDKTIECVLTGFSPNRQSLLDFKENLEQKEIFEEVYFPPASWVKQTEINFTANFRIKWK